MRRLLLLAKMPGLLQAADDESTAYMEATLMNARAARMGQVLAIVITMVLLIVAVRLATIHSARELQPSKIDDGQGQSISKEPFIYQPSRTMARLAELGPETQLDAAR